jgi:predicted cytidylate kinase
MPHGRSIVVNGDLGSGKTTVTVGLAGRMGLRRVSIGDLYRRMAHERGMTALQLNLHAELDDDVDGYVDNLQKAIAASGEQLVVDSRLAWVFFNEALKVHLITEPVVAAKRVLSRPSSEVEQYDSLDEAIERLRDRSESERARFITRYGADKERLRNYDVVCDTTRADPAQIIDRIESCFHEGAPRGSGPALFLDPQRIYPTEEIGTLRGSWDAGGDFVADVRAAGQQALKPIAVGRAGPRLFAIHGHRRLSAAIRNRFTIIPASLAAEDDEEVVAGLSANQYFANECNTSKIYDWEEAHEVSLPLPPHTTAERE